MILVMLRWCGANSITFLCPCCSLAALLYACRDGTGEIREILTSATFSPRLPGAPPGLLPATVRCQSLVSVTQHALRLTLDD